MMQRPNASMTRNPAMSVMTTARLRRPRNWYDGTGMYQFGKRPGGSVPTALHATASSESAVIGSAANASALNSSSEKGAPSLTVESTALKSVSASFVSL